MALLGFVLLALVGVTLPRALASAARGPLAAPGNATLTVESTPAGWRVSEAGRQLGVTPFTVSLPPGSHKLLLQHGSSRRDLDVTLAPGAQVVHHVDLPAPSSSGGIRVVSEPAGATVAVDGIGRGLTPVDVDDLAPGNHAVTLISGDRVVTQKVQVVAGTSGSLVVPLAAPVRQAVTIGWVAIDSPIDLEVNDGDSLVGSSRNQRIMLTPGRHALRVVNAALGFQATTAVQIVTGTVTRVAIKVPNGSLSVNAVPWAEVLLDGKVIGETPIANYSAPVGPHELVLRNPRYGEQRRAVVVSLIAPLHLGVDLRQ
jgi:hypothetical protein